MPTFARRPLAALSFRYRNQHAARLARRSVGRFRGRRRGAVRPGRPGRRLRDRRLCRLRQGPHPAAGRRGRLTEGSEDRMNPDWRARYELAVEAARRAGDLARTYYESTFDVP